MKKLLLLTAIAVVIGGCGAEWADCPTCKPGEDQAESSDGTQIPVDVNVTVNVDVNQTQNQGQGQAQGQTQTQTTPPATSTPDAGTPPKADAGTPSKPDAGCPPVCRKVCTCVEVRYVCNGTNKDTNKKSDCKCGVKRTYNKCTKEEVKCS